MYHVLALSGALSLTSIVSHSLATKTSMQSMIAMIMGMKLRRRKVILVRFPIATCTTCRDTTLIIFDFNTLSRHVANNTDTTNMTKLFRTRRPTGPRWRWVCSMTIKCHIKHGREKVMICDNIVSQRVLESLLTTSPVLIFSAQDTRDMVWPFGSRGWNQLLLAANKKLPLVKWIQLQKRMQQSC